MSVDLSTWLARSALYVPGDARDKLDRVLERGADEVIVDLEDAVAPKAKDAARETVRIWLHDLPELDNVAVWVRVNSGGLREADVRAVAGAPALTGFLVAKTETVDELLDLDRLLSSLGSLAGVVPLLESAGAVLRAGELAGAPRVQRLQMGEADLRADVGITPGPDERELLYARSHVVMASRAAGIKPPIAPVSTDFRDLDAFAESTRELSRLGFVGRACIHPGQVAVANEVFTPTADQVDTAARLVERWEFAGAGVAVDDEGRFVDEAVVRQARLVLARAR
ncbi:CoA ester lyase [Nocardioides sp. cx-173]|uniref:HpcH/HpaI aldolase/citrate lyase family protein n=1 Tax=Nocardioides sp. cx-173 TaxID=2898796 RepID=UPI001E486DF9|nr:CoA ester lyase [Nocardioides sp. cx-173]MCD4524364.1 CoA ester lyase [Nocardioides sp. cx-173]UGB43148.1 CoA ester lyase [Nocardioides sp. cx-173]